MSIVALSPLSRLVASPSHAVMALVGSPLPAIA
jgi:hypothetical protein